MSTEDQKDLTFDSDDSLRKPVSQSKLIWKRFKRHKLGVLGAAIIVLMIFVFLFAEFFAPYDYLKHHSTLSFVSPMVDHVKFEGLKAYVCELEPVQRKITMGNREYPLPGVIDYPIYDCSDDPERKHYLKFFAKGDDYKLLGLIPWDVHLFGTGEHPQSHGQFFLLGTDTYGQDLFSNIIYGGRITLGIAPMVILVSFLLGTFFGGLSGFLGGTADNFIQRIVEIFMSLPRLALLLAIMGVLTYMGYIPPMMRFWSIVGLLAIISWAPLARVIRGQFLSLREQEFTQAARALGAGNTRIIFRQIMPNIMSYLVVAATLAIPDIIILESILSFVNYGIMHPLVSWGKLLNALQGQGFNLHASYHIWLMTPAVFIVLAVLSFNFLGDALRDALDPFAVSGVKEDYHV